MAERTVKYSVVVPVFNSEHTLGELCERISKVLQQNGNSYEIILVDDCSSDGSWRTMKGIREKDGRVKIIHLMRNYGQANATICGFNYSTGEYVITIDDDLQNPPEEIPKLIERANEGYLVVYGKYRVKKHGRMENLLSAIFQALMLRILDIPKKVYISAFAILRSDVARNAASIKSAYPFLPALVFKSAPASRIDNVEVVHEERRVGRSNYTPYKLIKLSANLLINYSSLPLMLVGLFGTAISLLSIGFGILLIVKRMLNPCYGLIGWNSLIIAVSFLSGAILMGIGIIGEYLRRILAEISYEKPYIVEEMAI